MFNTASRPKTAQSMPDGRGTEIKKKHIMKRITYIAGCICLLINFSLSNTIHAQEIQYEEHSLRIMVKPTVSEKNIARWLETDSVLNSWIQDIRQSFPHSRDEMLQRVYYLNFSCPREQMETRMADLPWIEEIIPVEKTNNDMLYTPTDWFWKVTKTTDPKYLWHLTKIEAERAWDITKGSPDIKIAVIDKIIDAAHPDLVNKMVYDYDPYDPNIKMKPTDGSSHGTTVASFVAASTDDPESSSAQLAAIGFNCRIVGYRVSNDFLEKIHHAAFVENVSVIVSCADQGIAAEPSNDRKKIEEKTVKEILDHGTIIVVPAGNGPGNFHNNKKVPFYPFHPSYDNRFIIVSSTDINDNHTYYNEEKQKDGTHSHFNEVTVCAPGYSMMGAMLTGTNSDGSPIWPYYGGCSGTSLAAPIVAGLCGLMKSVFPRLTPKKAKQILQATTDPIKDAYLYPGQLGTGRINAYKAVLAVKQYADTCQANYTNQVISAQTINRNVCTLHMENATVKNNASATFKIDTEAYLGAGFSVEKGAEFAIFPE